MGMRADTEQQKRSPDALVGTERMLGCGGIRRGAYDLIESHHARGACHISQSEFCWKKVRAKDTITSQFETSAGVSEKMARAEGAR